MASRRPATIAVLLLTLGATATAQAQRRAPGTAVEIAPRQPTPPPPPPPPPPEPAVGEVPAPEPQPTEPRPTEPQPAPESQENPYPAEASPEDVGSASGLAIHGFVSQGFIKSSKNNYLAKSKRGSFELSEVGINLTKPLAEGLRFGVQLFARDLGPIGDYSAKFDWFYLDYRLADWLGMRAGRVKLPVGLYNEVADIDSARVPILLPQSIYSVRNRDYLLAQTGIELYGYLSSKTLGALDYRLYLGTIFLDAAESTTAANVEVPYVGGGRLIWESPIEGLRLGASLQAMRVDFDFLIPAPPPAPAMNINTKLGVLIWVGSLEYQMKDLLFAAEYSRWRLKIDSSSPLPTAPESLIESERFYLLAAYRLDARLTPAIYYSALYANVGDRDGREDYQHDLAATLRYDLGPNLIAKIEGHLMMGTADLRPELNGGTQRPELEDKWGVFLVKLTAYF